MSLPFIHNDNAVCAGLFIAKVWMKGHNLSVLSFGGNQPGVRWGGGGLAEG